MRGGDAGFLPGLPGHSQLSRSFVRGNHTCRALQYFTHTKRAIVDEWFIKKWRLFYGRWTRVSRLIGSSVFRTHIKLFHARLIVLHHGEQIDATCAFVRSLITLPYPPCRFLCDRLCGCSWVATCAACFSSSHTPSAALTRRSHASTTSDASSNTSILPVRKGAYGYRSVIYIGVHIMGYNI